MNEVFKNDEDLVRKYHNGDNSGLIELFSRYVDVIDKKIASAKYSVADKDDVKQEALISLLNAVKTFDANKGASFHTYANICIDNAVKNSLTKASARKVRILSEAVSLDEIGKDKTVFDEGDNPEKLYIDKEGYLSLLSKIDIHLSDFEKTVLFCYLDGNSYEQIANKLGSSQKAVDNALQRVRKKLKTVFL